MTKLTITAFGLALLLSACGDDVKVNMTESAPKVIAVKDLKLPFNEEQVCSDVTIEKGDGAKMRGTRRCEAAKTVCEKIGDTGCRMQDKTKYGIHDPELTPKNIRKGVKIGAKEGEATISYPVCTADGQTGCITTAAAVSVDAATIAAKTPQGSTVGGVAGTYDPGYPDPQNVLATDTVNGQPGQIATCAAAGQSNCVASAAFKPVPKTELDPTAIRQGATIGGVTGTYEGAFSACTADGATDCLTTAAFPALRPGDVAAARVREDVVLAGVTGTLRPAPAACNGSVKEGCVTTANFPAADYNLITAGNIKAAASIAHLSATVTGDFPSATHPLNGTTATDDLTASNFNASMASSDSFEYWTATGQRQIGSGDADLAAVNIATGITIFAVAGSVTPRPADCSNTLDIGCTTTATHTSYDKSLLVSANIKDGTTITTPSVTVTGAYPSAANPLPGASATADLASSTFQSQLQDGGTSFEYWDAAGIRHTGQGSNDLIATNLVAGVNVFGVTGTAALRPANCTDSNHTGCVTSATHPAYDPANLTAAMIKNGTTIGLVTGTYPSAGNPLSTATGTDDLTNFSAQLKSGGTFEYWDHVGNRYTGTGSTLISASNIAAGVTVFGVTGSMATAPSACTSAGQSGCLAVADYPSYDPSTLTASVIKNGHTIGSVTGTYPSAANRLNGDDAGVANLGNQADLISKLPSATSFEFWDATGQRHVVQGDADFAQGNIVDGIDIFGTVGTMKKPPAACTGEGQGDCLATATYRPFATAILTPGILKKGVSLGGVTGDYPSATHPLPGNTATRDLFESGASFATEVTTAGDVEFWDSLGTHYTVTRESLAAANVRQGTTILGVAGAALPAPAACTAATSVSCLTSTDFPAYQNGELTAANLKQGVSIGGVTGNYPSAAHPLAGDTAMPNLDTATFTAKIKSNAEFEYWDADGSRHTGRGSADIIPANILKDVSIFNVTGTMTTSGTIAIDMNDVRSGVKVGAATGSRKVSCANTATSGSSGNVTTDDYNANSLSLPPREPFGSTKSCRTGTFVDRRYGGQDCALAFECRFRDTITGKLWHSSKQRNDAKDLSWIQAKGYCDDLGMRVPTQKELMTAYVNGLRQASNVNRSLYIWDAKLWLATTPSQHEDQRLIVIPSNFNVYRELPTNNAEKRTFCVSP